MNEEKPISAERLKTLLVQGAWHLHHLSPSQRPRGSNGRLGGVVLLPMDIPCVIVPDLHARSRMIRSLLDSRINEPNGPVVRQLLEAG
ncbi:MAG: hypothetical protein N3A02_03120, partial [Rectinema sp.]|nr:hypothetical protein [Rectinema sp.]